MSLVTRGAGVGDGDGEGVGVGVCAAAVSGRFVAASPAAPRAGNSFTKVRRSTVPEVLTSSFFLDPLDSGCFVLITAPTFYAFQILVKDNSDSICTSRLQTACPKGC